MNADPSWADLAAGLPTHAGEVMASHEGRPTVAEQDLTHGVPAPEPDHGMTDQQKYGEG